MNPRLVGRSSGVPERSGRPARRRHRDRAGNHPSAIGSPRNTGVLHLRRRRPRGRPADHRKIRFGGRLTVPAKYVIHHTPADAPFPPRGQTGDRRLARGLFELPQLREAELRLRLVSRRGRHAARRDRLPRLHLPVQGLPELRPELHEEHPDPGGQPRVPPAGRRATTRRTSSCPRGIRRRRGGFRFPARATADRSAAPASIRCGPTCRRSSGPRATGSTAASTSAPAWTSAASCRTWRSQTGN